MLNKKHVGGPLAAELAKIGASLKVDAQWVDACATDLVDHAGHSIIVAGEHLPKSVHAIVIAINDALSAPINYVEVPTA